MHEPAFYLIPISFCLYQDHSLLHSSRFQYTVANMLLATVNLARWDGIPFSIVNLKYCRLNWLSLAMMAASVACLSHFLVADYNCGSNSLNTLFHRKPSRPDQGPHTSRVSSCERSDGDSPRLLILSRHGQYRSPESSWISLSLNTACSAFEYGLRVLPVPRAPGQVVAIVPPPLPVPICLVEASFSIPLWTWQSTQSLRCTLFHSAWTSLSVYSWSGSDLDGIVIWQHKFSESSAVTNRMMDLFDVSTPGQVRQLGCIYGIVLLTCPADPPIRFGIGDNKFFSIRSTNL